MKTDLSNNYSNNFTFKYIQTDQNPSDLVTRGLSFNKFKANLVYWQHGPSWLNTIPLCFPKYDLKCLNEDHRCMVQTFLLNEISENEIKPIIEFERFFDFLKLIRATILIFKFINKYKK